MPDHPFLSTMRSSQEPEDRLLNYPSLSILKVQIKHSQKKKRCKKSDKCIRMCAAHWMTRGPAPSLYDTKSQVQSGPNWVHSPFRRAFIMLIRLIHKLGQQDNCVNIARLGNPSLIIWQRLTIIDHLRRGLCVLNRPLASFVNVSQSTFIFPFINVSFPGNGTAAPLIRVPYLDSVETQLLGCKEQQKVSSHLFSTSIIVKCLLCLHVPTLLCWYSS